MVLMQVVLLVQVVFLEHLVLFVQVVFPEHLVLLVQVVFLERRGHKMKLPSAAAKI